MRELAVPLAAVDGGASDGTTTVLKVESCKEPCHIDQHFDGRIYQLGEKLVSAALSARLKPSR